LAPLLAVALAGCGPESDLDSSPQGAPAAAARAGVQISGTVANEAERYGEMLVFAYLDLASNEPHPQAQAEAIDGVGEEGEFLLSTPPAQRLTIVFLDDKENDGAIDANDPIAVLADPEGQLQGLEEGAEVVLSRVTIDFFRKRAGAASIEVHNAAHADVTATAEASPPSE
jgi:hypothetical protein